MHIERANSTNFTVTSMPDGSRILRSTDNSTVLALNSVRLLPGMLAPPPPPLQRWANGCGNALTQA